MSSAALEKSILVSYAGAAAEEIIYGRYFSGSLTGENNDFQKAANDIRAYIVLQNPICYSKTFLDKGLDEEVIAQSKLLYDEAKAIILDHKFLVLALAKELREKRSMSYEEIIACLKKAEKLNPSEDYIKEFLCELL